MYVLWVLVVVGIAYGSLWPFDFSSVPAGFAARGAVFDLLSHANGAVDRLFNAIVFVPVGFLPVAALEPGREPGGRLAATVLGGAALGVALQLAQLFLPSRDALFADALWNSFGVVVGAGGAVLLRGRIARATVSPASLIAALLCLCWGGRVIFPALTGLLYRPWPPAAPGGLGPFDWGDAAVSAVFWLIAGRMLDQAWRPGRPAVKLAAAAVLLLAIRSLALGATTAVSTLSGVGAAVAVLAVAPSAAGRRASLALAALAGAVVAWRGLAPFAPSVHPAPFEWLPFTGYLGAPVPLSAAVLCERLFVYGAILALLRRGGLGWTGAGGGLTVLLAAIELAQLRLAGHFSEITDPLLALLLTVAFAAIEREAAPRRRDAARAAPGAVES